MPSYELPVWGPFFLLPPRSPTIRTSTVCPVLTLSWPHVGGLGAGNPLPLVPGGDQAVLLVVAGQSQPLIPSQGCLLPVRSQLPGCHLCWGPGGQGQGSPAPQGLLGWAWGQGG